MIPGFAPRAILFDAFSVVSGGHALTPWNSPRRRDRRRHRNRYREGL